MCMIQKTSKKNVVSFNEEILYKEYKDYVDKDKDYLFKIFIVKMLDLAVRKLLKDEKNMEKTLLMRKRRKVFLPF